MPGVLRLLNFPDVTGSSEVHLLDLACGQGIAARYLPQHVHYTGVDAAPSLIKEARKQASHPHHQFKVCDVTGKIALPPHHFTHGLILLALQNIAAPEKVLSNAASLLQKGSPLIIVLNHPCFRIPRQSSWAIDSGKQLQYRRIDRYLSAMEIPIQAHPGQGKASSTTMTFHHPLSDYIRWLVNAGFVVDALEEWSSRSEEHTSELQSQPLVSRMPSSA